MTTKSQKVSHPALKGAEQHHPLKNQPGEKGDKDHMQKDHIETDETLSDEAAKAVEASDAETQIADALRDLADKD